MVTEEIQRQKEVKASTASVGTQTISFGEVDGFASKNTSRAEETKSNPDFIPENIPDDVKIEVLTSFTRDEFFG
ncbi:hypothetical protein TNCT_160961 [Trichonephila clavata]|uniref:Uncharacterized protein n=1 Tax=Trichonephila clavata TaxID=2740835 RepID=A0A8X6HYT6_TRICU|nr:hypothetical protein TNCT_160961 [Trichonephila clavata]